MCFDYFDYISCDLDIEFTYYMEGDTLHIPKGGGCPLDSAQCSLENEQLCLF